MVDDSVGYTHLLSLAEEDATEDDTPDVVQGVEEGAPVDGRYAELELEGP